MIGRSPSVARCALFVLFALLAGAVEGEAAEPGTTQVGEWDCQDEICQRISRHGVDLTLELRSRQARATWVVLELRGLSNVKALQATPFAFRLEPGETRRAGVLAIQDAEAPHQYQLKWRVLSGNPRAVHDDRWHYRMPFGGDHPIEISQGYDGPFSHKGASAYALDFPMPQGTPVLAARGGTIVEAVDGAVSRGIRIGENERDNRVVVEHVDGTFAAYAHLRPGGPARVGQRVETGDLIGLSGDTGFSTGPHLHFEVYTIRNDERRQTLPVRFWNGTKAGFTPLAGHAYPPGCARGSRERCRPGELASEP